MNIDNIIRFLSELKINNNREWFAENKAWYDQVRSEFDGLSKDLIVEISKFDEEIKHVEVKDCVFRIYRDTRFSHDKTPYKTHFGVFVATAGGRKSQRGGYYLHLDPAGSFVAVGVWCPEPNLLKALRQSVYDNIEELNEIRHNPEFSQYFNSFFDEDKLKTVPRGFPKDFPEAELLKLKHYMVEYKLDESILESTDFLPKVAAVLKSGYPLNQFLNYTVDETNS
jgi:TIGR02453 family protein